MIRISFKPLIKNKEEIICVAIDKSGNLPMELSWLKVDYSKFYIKYRAICHNNIDTEIIDMTSTNDIVTENIIAGIVINNDKLDYDKIQKLFDYVKETDKSIALPYGFGCNLKNKGNWNRIYNMIMDTFRDYEKDVILYKSIR